MKRALAFDTSTRYLSVACLDGGEIRASFHEDVGIRHSEILVPVIKNLLEEAGWRKEVIELVCVGLGPGSFTGLRIAAATVKGLASVLPVKVLGVPSMDAMVMNVHGEEKKLVAPLLDAHKGKVYSCIYERSDGFASRKTDYLLVTIEELLAGLEERVLFFGNGVPKYREKLGNCDLAGFSEDIDWHPRAADIGRLGLERSGSGTDDPEFLEPLYLHSKECNINK